MFQAKTLVHKAAMPIAVHAVRTFAAIAGEAWRLCIHSDGSLKGEDWADLEAAASGLSHLRVNIGDVRDLIAPAIASFPRCQALFARGGYMTKMAVLASGEGPFFYFDSDIVWLRPFHPTGLGEGRAVFSTETWSWYYAMARPGQWIRERVPRRINSGFARLGGGFPFGRLEELLERGVFNPGHPWATDQEFLAYLFPDCGIFSLDDFARSRRGIFHDPASHPAIALHFPGRMWSDHLDAIRAFHPAQSPPRELTIHNPLPLSHLEILRMKSVEAIETNAPLQRAANTFRRLRARLASWR